MGWLDKYFRTGLRFVGIGGVLLPPEQTVNFVSGVTGADNPGNASTDLMVDGGGGGTDLFAGITPDVTVADSTLGIIATLNLTPATSGNFSVVGSAGPGATTAMTTGTLVLLWNTAGGGISGAKAFAAIAMPTLAPELQGAGVAGIASGLPIGTSCDIYVAVAPSGDGYATSIGAGPVAAGGVTAREMP